MALLAVLSVLLTARSAAAEPLLGLPVACPEHSWCLPRVACEPHVTSYDHTSPATSQSYLCGATATTRHHVCCQTQELLPHHFHPDSQHWYFSPRGETRDNDLLALPWIGFKKQAVGTPHRYQDIHLKMASRLAGMNTVPTPGGGFAHEDIDPSEGKEYEDLHSSQPELDYGDSFSLEDGEGMDPFMEQDKEFDHSLEDDQFDIYLSIEDNDEAYSTLERGDDIYSALEDGVVTTEDDEEDWVEDIVADLANLEHPEDGELTYTNQLPSQTEHYPYSLAPADEHSGNILSFTPPTATTSPIVPGLTTPPKPSDSLEAENLVEPKSTVEPFSVPQICPSSAMCVPWQICDVRESLQHEAEFLPTQEYLCGSTSDSHEYVCCWRLGAASASSSVEPTAAPSVENSGVTAVETASTSSATATEVPPMVPTGAVSLDTTVSSETTGAPPEHAQQPSAAAGTESKSDAELPAAAPAASAPHHAASHGAGYISAVLFEPEPELTAAAREGKHVLTEASPGPLPLAGLADMFGQPQLADVLESAQQQDEHSYLNEVLLRERRNVDSAPQGQVIYPSRIAQERLSAVTRPALTGRLRPAGAVKLGALSKPAQASGDVNVKRELPTSSPPEVLTPLDDDLGIAEATNSFIASAAVSPAAAVGRLVGPSDSTTAPGVDEQAFAAVVKPRTVQHADAAAANIAAEDVPDIKPLPAPMWRGVPLDATERSDAKAENKESGDSEQELHTTKKQELKTDKSGKQLNQDKPRAGGQTPDIEVSDKERKDSILGRILDSLPYSRSPAPDLAPDLAPAPEQSDLSEQSQAPVSESDVPASDSEGVEAKSRFTNFGRPFWRPPAPLRPRPPFPRPPFARPPFPGGDEHGLPGSLPEDQHLLPSLHRPEDQHLLPILHRPEDHLTDFHSSPGQPPHITSEQAPPHAKPELHRPSLQQHPQPSIFVEQPQAHLQQPVFQRPDLEKPDHYDSAPLPDTHRPPHQPTTSGGVECGISRELGLHGRITASVSDPGLTAYGQFPWHVGVLAAADLSYLCAGVLVAPRLVLTVAHCLHQRSPHEQLLARVGDWDLAAADEFYPAYDVEIFRVIIHPEFYAGNLQNDVALLVLDPPVTGLPHVLPACLPPPQLPLEPHCTVTGWGQARHVSGDRHDPSSYSWRLRSAQLQLVPRASCQRQLRRTQLGQFYQLPARGVVCAAGRGGADACFGDGGGALVCRSAAPAAPDHGSGGVDRLYVAGLVSWGLGCGQDTPAVYTRVADYYDWIHEHRRLVDQLSLFKYARGPQQPRSHAADTADGTSQDHIES